MEDMVGGWMRRTIVHQHLLLIRQECVTHLNKWSSRWVRVTLYLWNGSAKGTIECQYEVVCDLSNGDIISSDLEWLSNPGLKVTVLYKGEGLKTRACTIGRYSYRMVPVSMTLDDLWPGRSQYFSKSSMLKRCKIEPSLLLNITWKSYSISNGAIYFQVPWMIPTHCLKVTVVFQRRLSGNGAFYAVQIILSSPVQ